MGDKGSGGDGDIKSARQLWLAGSWGMSSMVCHSPAASPEV